MRAKKKHLQLSLTEKDARIVRRALLKFAHTTIAESAPETDEEINSLYFRVDNLMRRRGILP